jgi:hypothetical protein
MTGQTVYRVFWDDQFRAYGAGYWLAQAELVEINGKPAVRDRGVIFEDASLWWPSAADALAHAAQRVEQLSRRLADQAAGFREGRDVSKESRKEPL